MRMAFLNPQLTASLQTYLHSTAFRAQYKTFSQESFNKVLRYGAPLGCQIEQHASLPRCMGRLKDMISEGSGDNNPLPSGTVVIAERLLEGSGRFDREWFAPEGGVWLAVAWADTLLPEFSRLLPLAAGIASCEAIREFGVNAAVKWVNDIHVKGLKIGGILCETLTGTCPEDRYHLIGIGINCNNTVFPPELRGNATSMRNELHGGVDQELFRRELLSRLAWNFGLVHLHEEHSLARKGDGRPDNLSNPVTSRLKQLSDTPGRKVVYGYDVVRSPLYRAVVKDIDSCGGLVMQLENGQTVTENSGEIIYLDM